MDISEIEQKPKEIDPILLKKREKYSKIIEELDKKTKTDVIFFN